MHLIESSSAFSSTQHLHKKLHTKLISQHTKRTNKPGIEGSTSNGFAIASHHHCHSSQTNCQKGDNRITMQKGIKRKNPKDVWSP
jgi:hypothetical protein